jgi:hypothetical protein
MERMICLVLEMISGLCFNGCRGTYLGTKDNLTYLDSPIALLATNFNTATSPDER